jgi:hypothetical protein
MQKVIAGDWARISVDALMYRALTKRLEVVSDAPVLPSELHCNKLMLLRVHPVSLEDIAQVQCSFSTRPTTPTYIGIHS